MANVSEVYKQFLFDALEDPGVGPLLGVFTEAQFLVWFNDTLLDFLKETGLIKRIYTQTVFAGVGQYDLPDDIMRVDDVFLSGRLLPQTTVEALNNNSRNWRRTPGFPSGWYGDEIPIKTIGLGPTPAYNGQYIPGSAEPDPPHAQYDDFYATVETAPTVFTRTSPPVHRGLTVVGPRAPEAVTSVDDPIPLLPDEFSLGYLVFGIWQRVFSGDNELKDEQRALYCGAQYAEGIALAKAITGEVEEQSQ